MVTPLEQVISSVAVVVQLPSVHLLVFWIVLHGPSKIVHIFLNYYCFYSNNQFKSSRLIDLSCTFCSPLTIQKKSFYEIEITRLLSLRSLSVQFAVSQIYNDVISISSKSLSAVQKVLLNTYLRGKITNQILKIQMPNMLLNDQLGYLLVAK